MSRIYEWDKSTHLFESDSQYILCACLTALCITGSAGMGLILWATWRHSTQFSISTKCILSLCLAELLLLLNVSVHGVLEMYGGGWTTGPMDCALNAAFIGVFEAISIFSVLGVTGERFMVIILRIYPSDTQANMYLLSIWTFFAFLFLVFPLSFGYYVHYYALESSKLVCAFAAWDNKIGAIITNFSISLVLLFIITFTIYAYYKIVMLYLNSHRKKHLKLQDIESSASHTSESSFALDTFSPEEMKLLVKSVCIAGGLLICWTPYALKIVVEAFTKKPTSAVADAICTLFVAFNSILNCVFLFLFDSRIKCNILETFGLEMPRQFPLSNLSNSSDCKVDDVSSGVVPIAPIGTPASHTLISIAKLTHDSKSFTMSSPFKPSSSPKSLDNLDSHPPVSFNPLDSNPPASQVYSFKGGAGRLLDFFSSGVDRSESTSPPIAAFSDVDSRTSLSINSGQTGKTKMDKMSRSFLNPTFSSSGRNSISSRFSPF